MQPARDRAQGLAEYALILSLVAVISIAMLLLLGGQMDTVLSIVRKSL